MPLSVLLLLAVNLLASGETRAQGSRADYERAAELRGRIENKVFRDRVQPHWLADGNHFWYRVRTGRDQHEFVLVDAERGSRQAAFDHERLAAALSQKLRREVQADSLPLDQLDFDASLRKVTFSTDGRRFACDLESYELEDLPDGDDNATSLRRRNRAPSRSRTSEEQTYVVFVNQTAKELQLRWRDYEGGRRPYGTIKPGETRRQHTFAGHVWEAVADDGSVLAVFVAEAETRRAIIPADAKPLPTDEPAPRGRRGSNSPDGRWSAELRDNNVWLRRVEADDDEHGEVALTTDGSAEDAYQEPLLWSPDSSKLLAMQVRSAQQHPVHLIESSPADQLQPKLHTFDYLKPGDTIARPRPRLFDITARQPIAIADELFAEPWSIDQLHWDGDSKRFTFLYNQRGHQTLRVIAVDAASGEATAIIDEKSPTFIDYNAKLFYRPLEKTGEIIWMSERDGWNHLYLYDARDGRLKNQITRGQFVVHRVEEVDIEKRQIWFYAGGVRPEQDPYYLHLCRVDFDGEGFTVLTEGDGTHEVSFSPDRRFLIDRWSRVDQPPVVELRHADDGSLVCELERANIESLTATGWTMPERFMAEGRDGKTPIYGIIVRPTTFDPAKSYPVVEQIYAGPHGAHVPKAFGTLAAQQALAELGFVVVQIDGMGTNWRNKAFHDVCWRNLADAGFADRIAWLKAAAGTRPWMDLTRVGIYGGSAGGQNAVRALLDHHDFYKVAVADCGCHDNRMDKIWWNELWMGYPVGPEYEASSNVADAAKLAGKLLLIVGELDRNVDPASTMQLVHALQKADKDFELLIVAGAGHGAAETPYGSRRRMDFLVRHLHGREPRWQETR